MFPVSRESTRETIVFNSSGYRRFLNYKEPIWDCMLTVYESSKPVFALQQKLLPIPGVYNALYICDN